MPILPFFPNDLFQRCTPLLNSSLLLVGFITPGWAEPVTEENDSIEVIEIRGEPYQQIASSMDDRLSQQGVQFSAAGGVSALPVLNGMMGDRILVSVDGTNITAACANQMNPPLSYVAENQVSHTEVIAGISPVSMGGDNIAGVIKVDTIHPRFSTATDQDEFSGHLQTTYNTIDDRFLLGVATQWSRQQFSLNYQGSYEDANSYHDGNDDRVIDTLYRAQNHALTGAYRDTQQQITVKLSHQYIPFQGFANQYMDMTDNHSNGIIVRYQRQLPVGHVEAQLNWQGVKHEMGFFSGEKIGAMPMKTKADDYSYQLRWTLPLAEQQTLILGQEYYAFQLDDWWPALEGSMMMGPNDYININNGKRQRLAAFIEWQQQLSKAWQINSGLRVERVHTNADKVQAYMDSPMGDMNDDSLAAQSFNEAKRKQHDTLVDITVSARYDVDEQQQWEWGLARKNRAPNLYERYSWGRSVMSSTMIGWFGDGNGYIGNLALKPETAYTMSLGYRYQNHDGIWQAHISPYYTKVHDYIDAEVVGHFDRRGLRHQLQFTNLDATLYGINANADLLITDHKQWGKIHLTTTAKFVRGKRDKSDEPLYQIMPFNTLLALQQDLGQWSNRIQWQWVDSKNRVDKRRLENTTASYHLLNWQTDWHWQTFSLSFAITNLLDNSYQRPLGGVSIAENIRDTNQGFPQLKGPGRSFSIGMHYSF